MYNLRTAATHSATLEVGHRSTNIKKSTTLDHFPGTDFEHSKVAAVMGRIIKINWVASILFGAVIFVALTDSVTARYHFSTIDGTIPTELDVPKENDCEQMLFGTGVQIYTYNSTAWVLTNVSADLYNFKGLHIGHHFFLGEKDANGGEASWETFSPFSRVTCKTVANVASPTDDAISWLLVEATQNHGNMKYFGSVTFVQRLYTQHGLTPAADFAAVKGQIFESNYTAIYKFSKKA